MGVSRLTIEPLICSNRCVQDVPDAILRSGHKKLERSVIMASRALKSDPKKSGTSHPTDTTEGNASETR